MDLRAWALSATLALASTAGSAALVDLPTDGTWLDFIVERPGDPWTSALDGQPVSFEVNSTRPFTLRVVDTGFAGDQADVLVDGVPLGATAAVPANDLVFAFSPDDAFSDPVTWSQGMWAFAAGRHVFSGTGLATPFGGALFSISAVVDDQSVPAPATLTLALLPGLAVLAARRRRRG